MCFKQKWELFIELSDESGLWPLIAQCALFSHRIAKTVFPPD